MDAAAVPKGMEIVLGMWNKYSNTKSCEQSWILMNSAMKKTVAEHFFLDSGHKVHFIPKFHCELNPIKCVEASQMIHMSIYTNFTILRSIVESALELINLDNIRKYFVKHLNMKSHIGKVTRLEPK